MATAPSSRTSLPREFLYHCLSNKLSALSTRASISFPEIKLSTFIRLINSLLSQNFSCDNLRRIITIIRDNPCQYSKALISNVISIIKKRFSFFSTIKTFCDEIFCPLPDRNHTYLSEKGAVEILKDCLLEKEMSAFTGSYRQTSRPEPSRDLETTMTRFLESEHNWGFIIRCHHYLATDYHLTPIIIHRSSPGESLKILVSDSLGRPHGESIEYFYSKAVKEVVQILNRLHPDLDYKIYFSREKRQHDKKCCLSFTINDCMQAIKYGDRLFEHFDNDSTSHLTSLVVAGIDKTIELRAVTLPPLFQKTRQSLQELQEYEREHAKAAGTKKLTRSREIFTIVEKIPPPEVKHFVSMRMMDNDDYLTFLGITPVLVKRNSYAEYKYTYYLSLIATILTKKLEEELH